jgi:ankyrin repeat protein
MISDQISSAFNWRDFQDSTTIAPALLHDMTTPLLLRNDPAAFVSDTDLATGQSLFTENPLEVPHSTTNPETRRPSESVIRSTSTDSAITSPGLARLRKLLRSGSYSAHVQAVLRYSSTDSFRSSIRSSIRSSVVSLASLGSSLKSARMSGNGSLRDEPVNPTLAETEYSLNTAPLSAREKLVWKELIDESMLMLAIASKPTYAAISLVQRPCCNLKVSVWQPNDHATAVCTTCGLGESHLFALEAKIGWSIRMNSSDVEGDFNVRDYFGNSPLHIMATRRDGDISDAIAFIRWMLGTKPGAYTATRNTSGETFLHVLSTTVPGVDEFLRLHKILELLRLSYDWRDFHGCSIAHAIFRMQPIGIRRLRSPEETLRVLSLMNADLNSYDSLGHNFRDDFCAWACSSFPDTETPRLINLACTAHTDSRTDNLEFRMKVLDPQFLIRIYGWPFKLKTQSWETKICTWVDKNGDTLLNALLKAWNIGPFLDLVPTEHLEDLVRKLLMNGVETREIRDRDGNTPLAVATRLGIRPAVMVLLETKANVHCRSYKGDGILTQARVALSEARLISDDKLYAEILSCMNLLIDAGAKPNPTERDEWLTPERRAEEKAMEIDEE